MNQESEEPSIWELRRGSELLAMIDVSDQDFPWNYGRISATEGFDAVRHYFCVQPNKDMHRDVQQQLQQQEIVLSPSGGVPVKGFTLIVEGDEARFQFQIS